MSNLAAVRQVWSADRIASYRNHYPHDSNLMEAVSALELFISFYDDNQSTDWIKFC